MPTAILRQIDVKKEGASGYPEYRNATSNYAKAGCIKSGAGTGSESS